MFVHRWYQNSVKMFEWLINNIADCRTISIHMCLAVYVRMYLLCISSCHHHSDKLTLGLRRSTLCQTLWCFFFVFGCIAGCIENFTSDHSKSSWNYPKTSKKKRTTNKKKKTIFQEDRKGCVSDCFRTNILFLCFYYWNFDFSFVFCSFVDIFIKPQIVL